MRVHLISTQSCDRCNKRRVCNIRKEVDDIHGKICASVCHDDGADDSSPIINVEIKCTEYDRERAPILRCSCI